MTEDFLHSGAEDLFIGHSILDMTDFPSGAITASKLSKVEDKLK
jgi:hypothetical protein